MYSTYDGAKKCARKLKAYLRSQEIDVALTACMQAIACGGGYSNWADLARTLVGRSRAAELTGFAERASLAVPLPAIDSTLRWAESEVNLRRARAQTAPSGARATERWHLENSDAAFAIWVMHRKHTSCLRPGSGPGQRLRLEIVASLCAGPGLVARPTIDKSTFRMRFWACDETDLFPWICERRGFSGEFRRLVELGVIEWSGDLGAGGDLVLIPPSPELVRDHIALLRESKGKYWREDAELRTSGAQG